MRWLTNRVSTAYIMRYCDFLSAWLQCTHLNVAAKKNGANCTSSLYAHAARQCHKAIDGRAEVEGVNLHFVFNSSQSGNHSIKIQFAQYFLINKLRVMQLDSGNTQISNVRLEFSNSSSVKVMLDNSLCFLIISLILMSDILISY